MIASQDVLVPGLFALGEDEVLRRLRGRRPLLFCAG
jgi:hypothetical protein